MKLLFLGTSHGIPEKGRFTSSVAVECDGKIFLVDAGAPVCSLLTNYGVDFNQLKAVFITHRHGDHNNGLPELIDQMTWVHKDCNLTVYFPDAEVIPLLSAWVEFCVGAKPNAEMKTYSAGVVYDDVNVKVTAMPTNHIPGHSYSFVFESSGKKVLFTGDMGHNYGEFESLTRGEHFDAIICEGAHFDSDAAQVQYSKADTDKLIISHVNPQKLPFLLPLKDSDKFETVFPVDGTEIEI